MAPGLSALLRLVRLVGAPTAEEQTDRQLLERFARQHSPDAFAALMHRYGGLVWGVCRRALGHAEDA
jgi:hypothetical protein